MRTTVTIDDDLLERAAELTGMTERTALLREGLQTLIRVERARNDWPPSEAATRTPRPRHGGATARR